MKQNFTNNRDLIKLNFKPQKTTKGGILRGEKIAAMKRKRYIYGIVEFNNGLILKYIFNNKKQAIKKMKEFKQYDCKIRLTKNYKLWK